MTDRYGKNTLDEIIQYLSSENSNAERVIKNKIEKQNLEIIDLEKKKTAEFKNTIENLLKNKEEELVVVQSQKPEEVKKPIDDENVNEQKQSVIKSIENISREVTSIQQRIDEYIAKRTELNTDIQNLSQIKQSLVLMQSNISQKMEEHKSFLLKYNLDINEVVKVDFRLNLIEDKIKSLTKQRSEIVESLDGDDNLYDKKKKKEALFRTAYELFTTKGINSTAISDIVEKAGVAKGTFYLYFKDKYDIKNKLIAHKTKELFDHAEIALEHSGITGLEDQLIFIIDDIINILVNNKPLLNFISKNLVMGALKSAFWAEDEGDKIFYERYLELVEADEHEYQDIDIMLFTILELAGSTGYNSTSFRLARLRWPKAKNLYLSKSTSHFFIEPSV